MKAIEAKRIADELNLKLDNVELDSVLGQIKQLSEDGKYYFRCPKLRKNVEKKLTELGYTISVMNPDSPTGHFVHDISWTSAEEDNKGECVIYSLPFDDKDASFMGNIQEGEVSFIGRLAEQFPHTVGFRKDMPEVWVCGAINRPYDVVVYEKGIKGPADWMFLNENGKWAHGGYTGYTDTYDNVSFIKYIQKIGRAHV